ncbi:MAG: alpha/beta hydrolase [Azospirillaceae bacterium]|nr:alpha/beta hydrolase [Azospirillaceae bacterium]
MASIDVMDSRSPAPAGPADGAGHWSTFHLQRPDGAQLRLGVWQDGVGDAPSGQRGTCVLVNGRSEFLEKYAEQAGEWAARGWRVVSFDWRGQGLSSRPLANRQKGHIDDFTTYLEDLDAILATLCPPTGPVIAFAHSMGGHLMLRHALDCDMALEVPRLNALILSAAMLEVHTAPLPHRVVSLLAALACHRGRAEDYAPGQHDFDPATAQTFANNPLTGDAERFRVALDAYAAQPDLILGGVTYGWLAAACRSIDHLRRINVANLTLPVQFLAAGNDRVVRSSALRTMSRRLPNAQFHRYPGAQHELMMERNAIRQAVWADIDDFLEDQGF